jgi:hypothetical protein
VTVTFAVAPAFQGRIIERGTRPRTFEDDTRFHSAMAGLMMERGFHGLARSHQIAAGLFLPEETRAAAVASSWVAHAERGDNLNRYRYSSLE